MIPRTHPAAPDWSLAGHRVKDTLDYSRGPEKTWVYGGLRPCDGQTLTMTASSRNSVYYQRLLRMVADLGEIDQATRIATAQLNAHAKPWIWGRPAPPTRRPRRRFVYHL